MCISINTLSLLRYACESRKAENDAHVFQIRSHHVTCGGVQIFDAKAVSMLYILSDVWAMFVVRIDEMKWMTKKV